MDILENILGKILGLELLVVATVLVILAVVVTMFIVAFVQGREIDFLPPRIGPKLESNNIPGQEGEIKSSLAAGAAFCYRFNQKSIEVLLVRTSARRWTFPKEGLESGWTTAYAAEKAAQEEAGVAGNLNANPLCSYRHWKQELKIGEGEEQEITVHLLEVQRESNPLEEYRDPTWYSIENAHNALSERRTEFYSKEFLRVLFEAKYTLELSSKVDPIVQTSRGEK